MAKVVVLGEGPRGTLAKTAIARLGLDRDRLPQVYAVGVKELWRLPPGRVNPLEAPIPYFQSFQGSGRTLLLTVLSGASVPTQFDRPPYCIEPQTCMYPVTSKMMRIRRSTPPPPYP
jgi:hypothetical protein